jgi:hypothetical protein
MYSTCTKIKLRFSDLDKGNWGQTIKVINIFDKEKILRDPKKFHSFVLNFGGWSDPNMLFDL